MDMMGVADPDAVHAVRTFIRKQIASELKEELLNAVWGPLVSQHTSFFLRNSSTKITSFYLFMSHR